jgi:hypothetical protein
MGQEDREKDTELRQPQARPAWAAPHCTAWTALPCTALPGQQCTALASTLSPERPDTTCHTSVSVQANSSSSGTMLM